MGGGMTQRSLLRSIPVPDTRISLDTRAVLSKSMLSSLNEKQPLAYAPKLEFKLTLNDYELLSKTLKSSGFIDNDGPHEWHKPAIIKAQLLIAKILILQPQMDFEDVMRFLRNLCDKARCMDVEIFFRIGAKPEVFFSARNGNGASNMSITCKGTKFFYPVVNGSTMFNAKNFFSELFVGKENQADMRDVLYYWRKAYGIIRKKLYEFDPSAVKQEDLRYFEGTLMAGEIWAKYVKCSGCKPTEDQVMNLLQAIFQHSRNKDTNDVVAYLKLLAGKAQGAGSPLVFLIQDAEEPGVRLSIKKDGLIHNAFLKDGKIHPYHPRKPGSNNPDLGDGIFYGLRVP